MGLVREVAAALFKDLRGAAPNTALQAPKAQGPVFTDVNPNPVK